MTKEQALQNIEGRIDTIQKLSIECIEYIYNVAYNEAIEDVLKLNKFENPISREELIRKLKK